MARGPAEVMIVGAGISGASTLFHATRRGLNALLVERDHPASGPTGHSSALLHAFYLLPELSELARRGTEQLAAIPEMTDGHSDYRGVGMMWAIGPEAVTEWTRAVQRIRGEGAAIETLSPEQLGDACPAMSLDGIAMAVWEPDGGYADPASSTNALVEDARSRGADVEIRTTVKRVLVEAGRAVGVETTAGEKHHAESVVLAAGPWTAPLLRPLGIDLKLSVERHSMAVVDAPGRASALLPFAWCDDTRLHYARPEGENLMLVGTWAGGGTGHRHADAERPVSADDPDDFAASVSQDESAWIVRHMTPRMPELEHLGLRDGYASLYDMSSDDLPIVGAVPGVEGLFVIAGTSGHGFKLGPAVGEELVKLITTGTSALLEPFSAQRVLEAAQ